MRTIYLTLACIYLMRFYLVGTAGALRGETLKTVAAGALQLGAFGFTVATSSD